MKTLWKYLKDQGGQFWGAFGKSLHESLQAERDRPLKEAMLKAEIGHKQAVAQKAQFDMQQALQREAAVQELSNILTTKEPKTVQLPGSVPNEAAGETGEGATVQQMGNIEMTDPRVRAALLKTDARGQVLTQAAKMSFPPPGKAGMTVGTWEEAVRVQNTPEFQAANPYGGRWVQTQNGIMFQGIHPVNPEAAIFHSGGGSNVQGALDYAYGRGASSGAGTYAGRTAQEIQTPIPQRQPFAGQPQPQQGPSAPNVGTPAQVPTSSTGPKPGETPEQTKQRLRKEAQIGATPPTQAQTDTIDAMTSTIGAIDQLFQNFPEKEIESLSGWSRFGQSLNQMGVEGDKLLGTSEMLGSKAKSERFSQYKNLVGMLKKTAFALGGKQLTPFEASVVFQSTPTDDDYSVDLIQKAKTLRDFTKASRAIRQRLMKEGRGNISMEELDAIMTKELGSRFAPGGQQQGGLPPPPAGWK